MLLYPIKTDLVHHSAAGYIDNELLDQQ